MLYGNNGQAMLLAIGAFERQAIADCRGSGPHRAAGLDCSILRRIRREDVNECERRIFH